MTPVDKPVDNCALSCGNPDKNPVQISFSMDRKPSFGPKKHKKPVENTKKTPIEAEKPLEKLRIGSKCSKFSEQTPKNQGQIPKKRDSVPFFLKKGPDPFLHGSYSAKAAVLKEQSRAIDRPKRSSYKGFHLSDKKKEKEAIMTELPNPPWNDLLKLQERMNKMFQNSLLRIKDGEGESPGQDTWAPRVDVLETVDELILKFDLPGVRKEQINLEVADNNLLLTGDRAEMPVEGIRNTHIRERVSGSFSRSLNLPASVDKQKIQATFRDGVLEVMLQKTGRSEPVRIPISSD